METNVKEIMIANVANPKNVRLEINTDGHLTSSLPSETGRD
jgi:hypothetical protein